MKSENDHFLSRLSVRLEDEITKVPIGSGILYSSIQLGNYIYLVTAAHCLYEDQENLANLKSEISISILNPTKNCYESIVVAVDPNLVSKSLTKDVAIIRLDRDLIEPITGTLPFIQAIQERHSITTFALKGFPSAARGKEVVMTKPKFVQEMPDEEKFQLRLTDDFTTDTSAESKVDGFSGSGVFLESHNRLYLFGIFTRFREAGKVAYCQYIDAVNKLLESSFLPVIPFTYIGEHGLTPEFFRIHNESAIKNLGPRFSEKLNLRLPIVSAFHDVSKDSVFKNNLLQCLDKWLIHQSFYNRKIEESVLKDIAHELSKLKKEVIDWIPTIKWLADEMIDPQAMEDGLSKLEESINNKTREVRDLRSAQWEQERLEKGDKKNKNGYEQQPYENELQWLSDVSSSIHTLRTELESVSLSLANSPILVIKGEPGCGKSHLLGDMTTEAVKKGVATLLFLGQHFKHGKTVWENILAQLGLCCTKEELLVTLNSIGKQQNARVLIMIDAINEGPGKDLWGDTLAGFIEDVKRYPFVGLVLSIRTTYFNAIIPRALQDDDCVTYKVHQGFKGNEYAALKLFCEHYELHTPNFPILAPEFTSPLFLQLICQGIRASGKKDFPQGFQGITQIFDYYIDAIYNKLVASREEYKNRKSTIRQAINKVAQACFEKEFSRILSIDEIVNLFDTHYSRFPHLLNDLIQENVFIQTLIHDYKTDNEEEFIYFTYERFGDFFIAEQLLNKYTTVEDIKSAFQKEGELGKLIGHHSWRNAGVLEAIAVRLPEKYNIEITEVCGWVFDKTDEHEYWNVDSVISSALWDSLKWRTPASIDDDKITAWLRSDQCKIRDEDYLLRLVELTTIHNHTFNSDRLFLTLNRHSMPDRDGFWQEHMLYYTGYNDDKDAFPLQRLIDWAWQKGISFLIEPETARLAGQTLAWLLSSTQVRLRDQTTKAMVNLLEEQPEALIKILEAFADTDDMYIAERLYAVAYGCALRTSSDANLKKIANYVYQAIFKDGNPPVHVLLRDYARNVIEYANHKGLVSGINMELVRPPYDSSFPSKLPSEADINQHKTEFEEADSNMIKERKRMYGKIHFDIMSYDFGEKTVESILRGFSSYNFTVENKFLHFKKGISRQGRSWLKALVDTVEAQVKLEAHKRGHKKIDEKSLKDYTKAISELYCSCRKNLKEVITPKEWKDLTKVFIPFLKDKFAEQKHSYHSYDISLIKRWLVQRAYDLGYDIDKHFEYDSIVDRHRQYREYKANRIGEKYQWIALHEIVARLGDNYYYNSYLGHNRGKCHFYQGPWEQYLRDIDPAFTTKNPEEEEDENLLHSHASIPKGWWFNTDYNNWNDSPPEWAANKADLPPLENIILCKDDNGEEWVYLKAYIKWREPKKVGQGKYNNCYKEVLYMINAYLIKKNTKTKIIKHLTDKNFFGRWMPETHSVNLSLFNRENYWSPSAVINTKGQKKWETIEETSHKVIITTSDAVGEMSKDKSDAHTGYVMPSKTLFDGMGLDFSSEDGSFNNSAGEIVVKSIGTDAVLIRKKELTEFLDQNGYDIFWTVLGEKNYLDGFGTNSKSELRAISGLYHLENGKITGDLFICNRNGEDAH